MVFCKVEQCPYNKNMWCSKLTVTLNPAGWCSELYKDDGNQKRFSEYLEYKKQYNNDWLNQEGETNDKK